MDHQATRRQVLSTGLAAAAAAGSTTYGAPAAGATPSSAALRVRVGFTDEPSTFYEVLEPARPTNKPPVVMIHGGALSGACYLATADGRPGWAQFFAARGHTVVVPDWPGTGRSGYVSLDQITGAMVVRGLTRVLQTLDRPAVVVTHSMSGPFGWKLLEQASDRIAALVAIAPGGPGNLMRDVEFLADSPDAVEARLAPAAPVLKLSKRQPFVAEAGWAQKKLIGSSTQWPTEHTASFLASLISVPPRLLLERVNYAGSAPQVVDYSGYRGKRVLVVIGTDDADHPAAIDRPIVEWLNIHGARADFAPLGDKGIVGNGHMLMMERNSDRIAAGIAAWLDGGPFPSPAG